MHEKRNETSARDERATYHRRERPKNERNENKECERRLDRSSERESKQESSKSETKKKRNEAKEKRKRLSNGSFVGLLPLVHATIPPHSTGRAKGQAREKGTPGPKTHSIHNGHIQ